MDSGGEMRMKVHRYILEKHLIILMDSGEEMRMIVHIYQRNIS